MFYINEQKNMAVYDYDWKQQPNWRLVQKICALIKLEGVSPRFYELETCSDDYAVLITANDMEPSDLLGKSDFYRTAIENWEFVE